MNPLTPPMGQGLVAGAQQAGGPPAGGTPGVGDTGPFAVNMQDKAFRVAQLLKALGLDTMDKRLSYGGSNVAAMAPGVFDAWTPTQGLTAGQGMPPVQDWTALLKNFAQTFNSQGAMGQFQQAGQNALNTITQPGFAQGIADPELMKLIQGFEALVNMPANDIVRNQRNTVADQGIAQFLQQPGVAEGTQRFLPYLQGNPMFNFLTGRK